MVARQQFFQRYPEESAKLDIERFNKFVEEGHIKWNEEVKVALENSEYRYSNDYMCNMIICEVLKYSSDSDLKQIVENSFIGYIDKKDYIASTETDFYDSSKLILLGLKITKEIRFFVNFFVVKTLEEKNELNNRYPDFDKEMYNFSRIRNEKLREQKFAIYLLEIGKDEILFDRFVRISREVEEMATSFILGHEYGHHHLGHIKNHYNFLDDFLDENMTVDEKLEKFHVALSNHEKEIMADKFGIYFFSEYLKTYKNYSGVYNYHYLGCVIAMIASGNINEDRFSLTHPSCEFRLNVILKVLKNIYGDKINNYVRSQLEWFSEIICNSDESE